MRGMRGMQIYQFSVSFVVETARQIGAVVNQDSFRRSQRCDRSTNGAAGENSPIPPIPLSPIRQQPVPSR